MAARSTKKAEEPKVEETKAPKAEEPKAEEPKAAEPKGAGKMILVRNKARFDYVQPSTGIKIYVNASEPTKVLDDGWVAAFVEAGLLERV